MAARKKVTDAELLAAYSQLGNVHKAGRLLGINGSSVHERLVKLGVNKPVNVITEGDKAIIRAYYTKTPSGEFDLGALAKFMGRTKPLVSRTAREMGLTDLHRPLNDAVHKTMVGKMRQNGSSRYKQGPRPELGPGYFRSRWEANYARYLNWLVMLGEIDRWEFESETFWFNEIKRGVRSYTPDFKIHIRDTFYFVEVKGYMDDKSLTKLKRMRIYHPHIDIRIFGTKDYKALEKSMRGMIKDWE